MRPLVVVELQKPVERALQGPPAGEVLPPKGDAPVLVQDRFLHPFHPTSLRASRVPGVRPSATLSAVEMVLEGIVKLRLTALSDAQHGVFTTGHESNILWVGELIVRHLDRARCPR